MKLDLMDLAPTPEDLKTIISQDLNDEQTNEYFDALDSDYERVDHLVAILDKCKFMAADNERKAQEYREAAELWESRLSAVQRYGIRLLNRTEMRSIETDDYILGLEQELPLVKSSVTKKYSTDYMIPDELIFSIPELYRQPKIVWQMRMDLVQDALLNRKKLNFAKLNDKQRLRILNKSEETL